MRVAVIQGGPAVSDLEANLETCGSLLDDASKLKPDIVLLSELVTTPTFAFSTKETFFDWAEPLNGRSVNFIGEKARKYGFNVIFPFFEKGDIEGLYYNSAAVIGRDGRPIGGTLYNGEAIPCYRKTHLPNVVFRIGDRDLSYNEPFYFKPGPGLPVFEIEGLKIGILICADRVMPEVWRVLTLQGAWLVFMPSAVPSWETGPGIKREELFVAELRVRALENGIFVVASNKGGEEEFDGTRKVFFGGSCIIDPFGNVLAQGPFNTGPALFWTDISPDAVPSARRRLPLLMMRRPELYSMIAER